MQIRGVLGVQGRRAAADERVPAAHKQRDERAEADGRGRDRRVSHGVHARRRRLLQLREELQHHVR